MPPKRRINAKPPPPLVVSTEPEDETEEVFTVEEEMLWCIKYLEQSLLSENITKYSLKSTVLALKSLKSSKAPLVKKRQVMRMSCGDYRKAMLKDAKKCKIDANKITVHPVTDVKTGSVIKSSKVEANESKNIEENNSGSSNFCFNFPLPECEELRCEFQTLMINSSTVS